MSLYIPDHHDLEDAYEYGTLKISGLSKTLFAFKVGQRMHIEAALQKQDRKHADPAALYHEWIEQEAHFEKERMEKSGSADFSSLQWRITNAVVRRAVLLFRSWNGRNEPSSPRRDGRNLRCNLAPYLDTETIVTNSFLAEDIFPCAIQGIESTVECDDREYCFTSTPLELLTHAI